MSYIGNDALIRFEEDNFIELAEEFLHSNKMLQAWAEFVAQKYEDSLPDEPQDNEEDSPFFVDDSKQL